MSMIFALTLDDIPVDKRDVYTYTDPKYSDLENHGTAVDPYRPWGHVVTRDVDDISPRSTRTV
jgi:hypothetical protein